MKSSIKNFVGKHITQESYEKIKGKISQKVSSIKNKEEKKEELKLETEEILEDIKENDVKEELKIQEIIYKKTEEDEDIKESEEIIKPKIREVEDIKEGNHEKNLDQEEKYNDMDEKTKRILYGSTDLNEYLNNLSVLNRDVDSNDKNISKEKTNI